MKVRGLLFVLALFGLLAGGGAFMVQRPTRTSCKPEAPIQLEASIIGDPISPFAVSAKATSLTGDEVELEIVLPNGVIHLGGERKARGKKVETRVDLRAQDQNPRQIFVRASISDGTGRISKIVPLRLFGGNPPGPKGALKRDSRGDLILEGSP
jgi:hypothetical protein